MSNISIDEFRTWLYQLVQNKKGALPDLDDWKLIKEQLDNVGTEKIFDDRSGYTMLSNDLYEYMDYEPYDIQFTFDFFDKLCVFDEFNPMMNNYNKEYDNGQTKTNSNRESDLDYDF